MDGIENRSHLCGVRIVDNDSDVLRSGDQIEHRVLGGVGIIGIPSGLGLGIGVRKHFLNLPKGDVAESLVLVSRDDIFKPDIVPVPPYDPSARFQGCGVAGSREHDVVSTNHNRHSYTLLHAVKVLAKMNPNDGQRMLAFLRGSRIDTMDLP